MYLPAGNELLQLQRFAELGRLSASLLHEISNPLTAALLHLELGDQRASGIDQARQDIELVWRYVEAARQQVCQQSRTISFNIQPELDQLKRIIIPLARKAEVRLDIEPGPDCRLYGDPVKFQHIVTNLVTNAVEAYSATKPCSQERSVRIALTRRQSWLIIRVTDWGEGIAASQLPQIFEPFYTTKGSGGHGLGIGLAIVKQYVTADFHGSIEASSSSRAGTQFTVRLRIMAR